jgi:hypothetical protein
MRQFQLFTLMLIAALTANAQEKSAGYFIQNNGTKVECIIVDEFKNNPTGFSYKASAGAENQRADIANVKEFGIYNLYKFVRDTVAIDRSEDDDLRNMSSEKEPEFKQEVLFLKVLVEGKASLYMYESKGPLRFFFKAGDSAVRQLVYKKYEKDGSINVNNSFREQIWQQLPCQTVAMNYVNALPYERRALADYFITYNKCQNVAPIVFNGTRKKADFNLTVRPRLNYTSLTVSNSQLATGKNAVFSNKISPGLGIEAEVVLPYNKKKWALFIEPTFNYYKNEFTAPSSTIINGFINTSVNYKTVDLPIGIRHYVHLNKQASLFINGSVINSIPVNSSFTQTTSDGLDLYNLDIRTPLNLAFGAGFKSGKKLSVEFRYNHNRQILATYSFWNTKMRTASIILGYTLF